MAKKKKSILPSKPTPTVDKKDANILLQEFLNENDIKLVPELHEAGHYFVDNGFVLNDKPQVRIKAEYGIK